MVTVTYRVYGTEKRFTIDATGNCRIRRVERDRGPERFPMYDWERPDRTEPDTAPYTPGRTHSSHRGDPDPDDLADPDLLERAKVHADLRRGRA